MQRLKRLLKWLALVLVVAVAGTAAWVLWTRNQAPQTTSLTQVVTVGRGNLVATISPTGEVYAPRQAELSFDVNKIELAELNVAAGQQVKAGDVLARIDPTTLEWAVTQAEANLTVAQSELEKVQNPYTDLDLAGAQRAVTQAQVNLENAQKNLLLVQTDSDNAQRIRDLEYEVNWYETNYGESLQKYEQGHITKERLDLDFNNLVTAKENLERALLSREIDLANAQDQVAQAEYNLQKAQASLAEILAGPDPKEIEVAQAKVTSAQAALEDAQAALEAATLVAPFDGTVMSVGAEVGDLVSSTTIVVTLADLSNLRVRAFVDETDISQVEVGQEVEITFDAFPGQKFQGQVLEVPLQGTLSQNVLTYEVPVSLEGPEDVSLKTGMTANLKIVVGQRENVLLVPALAVQQGEEGNVVMVQDSPQGPAVQTPVELGLSDGLYVEVVRGLNEGDQVVIEYQPAAEEETFGFPAGGSRIIRDVPGGGQERPE
jgi:HlyD family secretion protein